MPPLPREVRRRRCAAAAAAPYATQPMLPLDVSLSHAAILIAACHAAILSASAMMPPAADADARFCRRRLMPMAMPARDTPQRHIAVHSRPQAIAPRAATRQPRYFASGHAAPPPEHTIAIACPALPPFRCRRAPLMRRRRPPIRSAMPPPCQRTARDALLIFMRIPRHADSACLPELMPAAAITIVTPPVMLLSRCRRHYAGCRHAAQDAPCLRDADSCAVRCRR